MCCQYQVQVKLKQMSTHAQHGSSDTYLLRDLLWESFGSGSEQAMSNLRLDCVRQLCSSPPV